MRQILITGASGLIGGHAIMKAVSIYDVSATYCQHPFRMRNVHAVQMDLRNPDQMVRLVRTLKPDAILHAAAMTDVDGCEADPDLIDTVNHQASVVLAEEAARLDCRFLFLSSDMVFDGDKGNYTESDTACPLNIYGQSKLKAEADILSAHPRAIVVRLALAYGNPITGGQEFSRTILKKLSHGEALKLFKDQYRTPVLAQNAAELLLELIQSDFSGLIHLGGPDRLSRLEFGQRLARVRGLPEDKLIPISIHDVKMRAKRPADASLDSSLARSILKTPFIPVREGVRLI